MAAGGGGGGSNYTGGLQSTSRNQRGSASGGDGQVTISYTEPPQAPTNASQTVEGNDQIQVDATENTNGGSYDNYRIEVSEDGSGYTHVASPASMPYTYSADPTVDTHRFRVRGENTADESGWTYTSTKSTAITSITTSNPAETSFDVAWDTADDASEYDVLLAEASGSAEADYAVDQTVSGTSATVTDLEHGERQFVRVIARYPNADSLSTVEETATTTVPAPTLDSLDASTEDELTVQYTLTDNSTDGDVLLERSTDDGSTWADAGTVTDLSKTSSTDTGRPDGVTHTYRVTRRTDHAEATSGTLSATTILPEGTDLQVGAVDDTSIDLSWTVNADNGEQRVEYRRASESDWSTDADELELSATSEVVDSLLNGEKYDVRVVTYTEDVEAASTPISATTELPDEDQPVLGNGVEDEIAVDRETQPTNYGQVRVQTRETGESSWDSTALGWDEQVLAFDTLSTTVTGREDGEEYEHRLRTETEHRTGAWTDPVSIVTKFPGATGATVESQTPTSVTVSGTDHADNEDGFRLEREEQISGEWRERQIIETQGPNDGTGSISITDSTPSPDTTYRYRIEAYTEHATGVSDWTNAVTTDSLGVPQTRTGSRGWAVRVEHADGSVHRPTILDDAQFNPSLNALPTASVPVPRDEKWLDSGFENADVKAWKDGQRLPVDELHEVTTQPGQMTLELRGGTSLLERVQREVDQQDAHLTAEDIITTVGLTAHVDDPAASTRADVLMQDADTTPEFQQEVPGFPFPSDDPRVIQNGRLTTYQSMHMVSAPDMQGDFEAGGTELSDSSGDTYIEHGAVRFDGINQARETTVTLDYDHSSGTTAGFRINYNDSSDQGMQECTLLVDDEVVESYSTGDRPIVLSGGPPYWFTFDLSGLSAGEHTLRMEMGDTYDDSIDDVVLGEVAVVDDRYDALATAGGHVVDGVLQGRRLHPAAVDVETTDADSIEQVVAGELLSTWTSTANGQAVAISNDQGGTWHEAQNASSVQADFDSGSAQIRVRVTLSNYDSGSGPVEYDSPAAVDVYELRASLEDTPLLVNKSYDGSALSVLNEIAEYGDFIYEVRWDSSADAFSVEWTSPGQRQEELDPDISTYQTEKKTGDMRYGTVIAKGSNRTVSSEPFTSVYDTQVSLVQDNLLEGSEAVYDPASGTQYEANEDYDMDYSSGAITVRSNGDMSDNSEYQVDYRYRVQGSYTTPSAPSDAETLVRDFAGATDDRECGQIALNIVKEIQEPLWEAQLTVSKVDAGVSLVDDVAVPDLPTQGERMEIRSIEQTPREVVLTLGSRRSLSEVVDDIRSRLEAVTARS